MILLFIYSGHRLRGQTLGGLLASMCMSLSLRAEQVWICTL